MEFEICDLREKSTCKKVRCKIQIYDDLVSLADPDGIVFAQFGPRGEVYLDPDRYGSSYCLVLKPGYDHTYTMQKKC